MKTNLRTVFALALLGGTHLCWAAPGPWDATWKLNESKSFNPPGAGTVISLTPDGLYRWQTSSVDVRYRCDGKQYPMEANTTISCSQSSPRIMDTISLKNGKQFNTNHREVSLDGKTLTVTGTSTHLDGSKDNFHFVLDRVTGSSGFAGSWRDRDTFGKSRLMLTSLSASTFRVELPLGKRLADMKLDGSDSLVQTQDHQSRTTQSVRRDGPLEFLILTKVDGTPTAEQTLTLSHDGMTLNVEFWNPNHPSVTGHWTYERQK